MLRRSVLATFTALSRSCLIGVSFNTCSSSYRSIRKPKAEQLDPDIEHVGTWHSHHCNGLKTLSGGDVDGYFATVNKKAYRLQYFVASLVKHVPKDPMSEDWIDHFLFVRGDEAFYHLTTEIKLCDLPTAFGALTGHVSHHSPKGETVDPEGGRSIAGSYLWYESEVAKRVLSEDKRLWVEHFGEQVRTTRLKGRITLKGMWHRGGIAVTYPLASGERRLEIEIVRGSHIVVSMQCDLDDRAIAYRSALAARDQL
jgi:hypothetical protein